jgi:hypothetical protein
MANVNSKSLILGILIGVVVLGVTLYFTGLLAPPVAVEQVKQPTPPPSRSPSPSPCDGKQRQVKLSTLPADPEVNFEFAVLCKDDVLTWEKGNGAKSFTVDFKPGTPLKGKNGVDKSHFTDSQGDASGIAKDLQLQPGNFAYYKYTVTVTDSAGKQHINDPGVIIVP